jgi:hypothetical protein
LKYYTQDDSGAYCKWHQEIKRIKLSVCVCTCVEDVIHTVLSTCPSSKLKIAVKDMHLTGFGKISVRSSGASSVQVGFTTVVAVDHLGL